MDEVKNYNYIVGKYFKIISYDNIHYIKINKVEHDDGSDLLRIMVDAVYNNGIGSLDEDDFIVKFERPRILQIEDINTLIEISKDEFENKLNSWIESLKKELLNNGNK